MYILSLWTVDVPTLTLFWFWFLFQHWGINSKYLSCQCIKISPVQTIQYIQYNYMILVNQQSLCFVPFRRKICSICHIIWSKPTQPLRIWWELEKSAWSTVLWWHHKTECGSRHWCHESWDYRTLTHWGRDKIDAIMQTTLSSAFSWMKMHEFRLRFHWNLFLRVQSTIFQHWFR